MMVNEFPPTLRATVELLEPDHDNGLCFHRSAALCYDMAGSMVVIGIFNPDVEAVKAEGGTTDGQPFYHCWVEFKGCVFAPTTLERLGGLQPMHRLGYYNINGVSLTRRIPRRKLLEIFAKNPELLNQLKFGIQPGKEGFLVDKLMKAARLDFTLTPTNGVIPK